MFGVADGLLEARVLDLLSSPHAADALVDPWRQLLALRACSRSWRDKAGPRLWSACARRLASEDAAGRYAALTALSTVASAAWSDSEEVPFSHEEAVKAAVEAASKSLDDEDPDVRRAALRSLVHVARPDDHKAFCSAAKLLHDRAWPVRWAAVDAVARLASADRGAAAALLAQRLEDSDWPVRGAAVTALSAVIAAAEADFSCGEAVRHAVDLLRDGEEDVRAAAAAALPGILADLREEVPAALGELMARVASEERHPRALHAAVLALRRLADPGSAESIAALHQAVRRTSDDAVRRAAQDAINAREVRC